MNRADRNIYSNYLLLEKSRIIYSVVIVESLGSFYQFCKIAVKQTLCG